MRGRKTSPEAILNILDVGTTDPSLQGIATITGNALSTVTDLMHRYEPVAESLRGLKRDWFVGMWQAIAAGVLNKLHRGLFGDETMTANDAKAWAITGGIATEKILLLTGQPTAIVAGIHEVRHELGPLVARLMAATERVREPLPVVDAAVIEGANDASVRNG